MLYMLIRINPAVIALWLSLNTTQVVPDYYYRQLE